MSKLNPTEQAISAMLDRNMELEEDKARLSERLKATTGLLRSLLLNNAVTEGLRGKVRQRVNLNEQELKPKS